MQQGLIASIALGAAITIAAAGALEARSKRRGEDYFTNLPVVTQDGKTLRFYDDLIKGKIVLINFIYTNCPDICPLTTARLVEVQEKLGDSLGRDIFFYSITVDPERDTPEQLKKFAEAFHVCRTDRCAHSHDRAGPRPADRPRAAQEDARGQRQRPCQETMTSQVQRLPRGSR